MSYKREWPFDLNCYVCKKRKDFREFYRDASRSAGRMSKCKRCCDAIRERRRRRNVLRVI